ncbi:MAG: ribonuclease P protein component [Actinomycetota bacterium]
MIERIRTRDAFQRLRRDGRRVRADVLWCTYVLDPTLSAPHVAFAIGRPVGSAVTRNRLRRRLRALLSSADLPAGWFLIGASPAASTRSFDQLAQNVTKLAQRVSTAG